MKIKFSLLDRLKILLFGKINKSFEGDLSSVKNNITDKLSNNLENHDAAIQTLMLFQKHARLMDFINEDIDCYTDEEIGGAARVVHQGCQTIFKEYIKVVPLCDQKEESTIHLQEGFDARSYKLTGDIKGSAPFEGKLIHAGWKIENINLPKSNNLKNRDNTIISPAEVEL